MKLILLENLRGLLQERTLIEDLKSSNQKLEYFLHVSSLFELLKP